MAKYRFDEIAINVVEKKKPAAEDRFTYIGLEHLDNDSLSVKRYGADVAPIGEKLIMKKGDVLFGKRRAYQKKVAIAPFDGIFSAHGMVLRPKENVIDKDFFPLFISSDYFLDAAIKISVGSLSPTINWKDLKELEFNLPPIEEQEIISKILWSVNDTIEAYKKLTALTDELIKAKFIEMFGDVFKESSKWKKVPFEDAVEDATHKATKIPKNDYLSEGKYPIIDQGQKEILGYRNDDKGLYYNLPAIVFGDHTRIFKYVNTPFFLGADGVKLLKIKKNNLDYIFLLYELRIANIPNTGYNRHFKLLKNLNLSIPPLKYQKHFANFVQQSDKSKSELERAITAAKAMMKRIIAENLRGGDK